MIKIQALESDSYTKVEEIAAGCELVCNSLILVFID